MYPENYILNVEQSASRLYGLFMIGGCNSAVYSNFFFSFVKAYDVGIINFDPGK
jgi:hypothetical protein